MSVTPCSPTIVIVVLVLVSLILWFPVVTALGSASTVAITFGTSTVCGIIAGETTQRIQCYQNGQSIWVLPDISFAQISGGESFFCGLMSGGLTLLCWNTTNPVYSTFMPRRIYFSQNVSLTDLAVGDDQVCAREVDSGLVRCWRGGGNGNGGSPFSPPGEGFKFSTITSGKGFSCGILNNSNGVLCWGGNGIASEIQTQFGNLSMLSLVAGESHVCGLTGTGSLVCKGNDETGQLDVPSPSSAFEFSGLALGANFTCALRQRNGYAVCWGGGSNRFGEVQQVQFESIVAGLDFVCGLTTGNLSLLCWGPGWSDGNSSASYLPLGTIIPGPCVQSPCVCGLYPDSETLCGGSGSICRSCQLQFPIASPSPPLQRPDLPSKPPPPPPPPAAKPLPVIPAPTKSSNKLSLGLMVVGSFGGFAGICAVAYCLWAAPSGCLHNKMANSVQPATAADAERVPADAEGVAAVADNNVSLATGLRSCSTRYTSFRGLRYHRTESTSSKYAEKTQQFSLSQLAAATNNFSLENKIGSGSFGTVYKGKLPDGREVAIKRGETSTRMRKFKEKESAFESELALLSRLHHKHLVGLAGFCQENAERLLVYEYMSNGSLRDHLHSKNNVEKNSSILNSWKMRIKIALDAARGIEYLHNYAVPPIIHRDIKSANILLDANWMAKVSDFGLSLMGPESDQEFMSTKAAGTVGYIDPEYYVLNVLTAKSDVYGLGVVLLELLTGKKAVFKNEEDETCPMGVVEYASSRIQAGDLWSILDRRVGQPEIHEAEAVELMAYVAAHCVNLEGNERPSMTDIVANLERALAFVEDSPSSFSNRAISISSD
ncbi:hypothetical protein SLE2022_351370 [Rubroshorea leprosula]